jgi:ATP-dependent Lon protease
MDTNEEKRESGFNNLVIPHGYKELLKAMVKNYSASMDSRSGSTSKPGSEIDLVRGKGRGLIIFLYGPPGVGKVGLVVCLRD